jgi:hypothetical protein
MDVSLVLKQDKAKAKALHIVSNTYIIHVESTIPQAHCKFQLSSIAIELQVFVLVGFGGLVDITTKTTLVNGFFEWSQLVY